MKEIAIVVVISIIINIWVLVSVVDKKCDQILRNQVSDYNELGPYIRRIP